MIKFKKYALIIMVALIVYGLIVSITIKDEVVETDEMVSFETQPYFGKIESSIITQPMSYVADNINQSEIYVIPKEFIKLEITGDTNPPKGKLLGDFIATGYNLSVESCGKSKTHPAYGITASGYSLVGHTRESAMVVATDPKVIPLGTEVYLEFPERYEHFDGIYTSRDTGGAIKGNKVDVFMGEDMSTTDVYELIGKQEIKVYLVSDIK